METDTAKELESLITCSVCLEIYSKPRVLKCLHTYCSLCVTNITNYNRVICPECRDITTVPDIKPDFKTQALIDLHGRSINIPTKIASGSKSCDICENNVKVIQSKCTVCEQFMCSDCERSHKKTTTTKDHPMMSVGEVMNSLTAKLEGTKTELVKNQQLLQMHSQGSDTIIQQILKEKSKQLERVCEYEEVYMREIKIHHDTLRKGIEDKAEELISELENYKTQNKSVEDEIARRVQFLTATAAGSKDIPQLTDVVDGIGQSFTEDVAAYKSKLPDLRKSLQVKIVMGERIPPQQLTQVLFVLDENVHQKDLALPGRLSMMVGLNYRLVKHTMHKWGLSMKLDILGNCLWLAAYNDGVYIHDLDGNILQQITHKYMSSACGVAQAYNGEVIVACGEHHDLLRFDKGHSYIGRITSGSFSDVYAYREKVFALDYDRGMVLVFDFNPNSNKWFCISHWKIEGYSYGHYCDKLKVNDTGIYISSYSDHCVYILKPDGNMSKRIGAEGSGRVPGTFEGLILCDVDPKGNVLVCDRVSHNIHIFQKDNEQWSMLNIKGKEQIQYPTDVAVDETGNSVWVVTNGREMLKLQVSI